MVTSESDEARRCPLVVAALLVVDLRRAKTATNREQGRLTLGKQITRQRIRSDLVRELGKVVGLVLILDVH